MFIQVQLKVQCAIDNDGGRVLLNTPPQSLNLGRCYEEGKGMCKDEKKAYELYQRAALHEASVQGHEHHVRDLRYRPRALGYKR